jgi:hypothetical protein
LAEDRFAPGVGMDWAGGLMEARLTASRNVRVCPLLSVQLWLWSVGQARQTQLDAVRSAHSKGTAPARGGA